MICIYKITNPKGKIYIGQTTDYEKRKKYYISNTATKTQTKLYNSINKYGWESHTMEVIEICKISQLNERERYYQELYNAIGINGLNCRLTKTNDKSGLASDESKKKLSESKKADKKNTERISQYKKNWVGRKHTEETKQKMRLAALGKPKTKEHIAKLPQNQKGKFRPKNRPETTKKQINSSPFKKTVLQYDLNMVFIAEHSSANQAAKSINLNQGGNIRLCCSGKLKSAYGFIWRYE